MTHKTQPTAHAEITAPISADLRGIEQDAQELPEPSATAGKNLGQRILHVGGRENAAGYIEFGSVAAVRALIGQVLRDMPSRTEPAQCLNQVAEPAPVTYMTTDHACKWAWDQVRKDVGTEGWTTSESCNFYGFFMWGWHYRGQYETQRPAAPPAPAAVAVPDEAFKGAWLAHIAGMHQKHDTSNNSNFFAAGFRAALAAAPAQAVGRVPPGWQVPLATALGHYQHARDVIGGCTDGGCVIKKPKGMHTNGGCRCLRAQHVASAMIHWGNELAKAVQVALAAAPPPPAAQERYRLLVRGVDTIQAGDEFLQDDAVTWQPDPNGIFVGMTYVGNVLLPARRAIEDAP